MKKKTLIPKQALSVKLNAKEVRLLLFLCNRKTNFFDMKSATRKEIVKTNKKITLEKEFNTLVSNKLANEDGSNLNLKKDEIPFVGIPVQRLENVKNNKQLFIMSLDCRNKNNSTSFISFEEISAVFNTTKIRDIKLNLNQLRRNMNVKFEYTIDELSNRFTFFDMDLDMSKEDVERKVMKKKSKVKLTTQEEIIMKQAMEMKAIKKPTMKDEMEDWGDNEISKKMNEKELESKEVYNHTKEEIKEQIEPEKSTIAKKGGILEGKKSIPQNESPIDKIIREQKEKMAKANINYDDIL